jgi:hypothetical protein
MSAANIGRNLAAGLTRRKFTAAVLPGRAAVHLSAANIPLAKYGGRHTVTMMPGSGIGPEMMEYVKEVFKAGWRVRFWVLTSLNVKNVFLFLHFLRLLCNVNISSILKIESNNDLI